MLDSAAMLENMQVVQEDGKIRLDIELFYGKQDVIKLFEELLLTQLLYSDNEGIGYGGK